MPGVKKRKYSIRVGKGLQANRPLKKKPSTLKASIYMKYKKVKQNNLFLAKALASEKAENGRLYEQNVKALASEQEMSEACNTRNEALKLMLKNLTEAVGYLLPLSTLLSENITLIKSFISANATPRSSINSLQRESLRRLSLSRSPSSGSGPTKGVVRPMVSGHTIEKPTISLSRVNMRNIRAANNQNALSLSLIEEADGSPNRSALVENSPVLTPPRPTTIDRRPSTRFSEVTFSRNEVSPENEPPPAAVNVSRRSKRSAEASNRLRKRRSTNRSTLNAHEETTEVNPRRHSSDRSNRVARVSLSDVSRHSSVMNITQRTVRNSRYSLGSPRVKLNDVGKLMQDSQTINVRSIRESSTNLSVVNGHHSSTTIPDLSATSVDSDETPTESRIEDNLEEEAKSLKSKKSKSRGHSETRREVEPQAGCSWMTNDRTYVIKKIAQQDGDLQNPNDQHCFIRPFDRPVEPVTDNALDISENEDYTAILNSRKLSKNVHFVMNDEESEEEDDNGESTTRFMQKGGFINTRGRRPTRADIEMNQKIIADFNQKQTQKSQPAVLQTTRLEITAFDEPTATVPVEQCMQNTSGDEMTDVAGVVETGHNSLVNGNSFPALPDITDSGFPDSVLDTSSGNKKRSSKTSSESEESPVPSNKRRKRKTQNTSKSKKIDCATVLLEKLNDSKVKRSSSEASSFNSATNSTSQRQINQASDSESVAEDEVKASRRPRREKAPTNLQEPSAKCKLRRK